MNFRQTLQIVWLPVLLAGMAVGALIGWAITVVREDPLDPLQLWWMGMAALLVVGAALGAVMACKRALNHLLRGHTELLALEGAARERAETALDDHDQSLASTLDSIRDAVIVTDAQGRIVRLNAAGEELAGRKTAEVVGEPMREVLRLLDPETRQPVDSAVEAVLASPDKVAYGSDALLVAGGREIRVSETCVPILSRGGKPLGAALALRDVTREHALRDQLREANRFETVRQLAGGLAHDFNNLLAAVMGNAELMRIEEGERGGANRIALDEIVKASQRASSLTQQLLAFSREGHGEFQQADVHELIRRVLGELSADLDPRIAIETALAADRAAIDCDAPQLLRVLRAVCENAREAMPAGGTLRVVTRSAVPSREQLLRHRSLGPVAHLEVRISDSGTGMPPEVRRRVFEPFFTTKRGPESGGLSLASAYGSIRSHGGTIEVESEVGKGSTFTILLPLSSEPLPEARKSESVRRQGRVLIVDDDEGVRTLSSRILEVLGFDVASCADGAQALDFFAKHHRDVALVLLDLTMPRLGGEGVFERMREIDDSVPVVIVSGYVQSPKAHRLVEHGACGVLWKPFHIDDLARTVKQYVSPPDAAG